MSAASTVVRTAEATPFSQGLDAMASSTLADRYADPHLVADIVLRYGPPAPVPAHRGIGGVVLGWGAGAAGLQMSSRYGDLEYYEQLQATRGPQHHRELAGAPARAS